MKQYTITEKLKFSGFALANRLKKLPYPHTFIPDGFVDTTAIPKVTKNIYLATRNTDNQTVYITPLKVGNDTLWQQIPD